MKDLINLYRKKEKEKKVIALKKEKSLNDLNKKLEDLRLQIKKNNKKVIDSLKGYQIERDTILEICDKRLKSRHRCLKVKCLDCGMVREVALTKFLSNRPLREGKCICKNYLPKNDFKYTDTIRGTHIYIGKDTIIDGVQKIWIKCLICNKYSCVIGKKYLNGEYINSCNHKIEISNLEYEKSISFKKINKFYSDDYFKINDIIDHYRIINFYNTKSKSLVELQCLYCNDIIKISKNELLSLKHTQTLYHCSCYNYNIEIGQIYGNLKVLSKIENNKYLCKCLYGNTKQIVRDSYSLRTGISLSCGCLSKSLKSKYNRINYIGQIYNNLQIKDMYISESKKDGVFWECKCLVCNEYVKLPADLVVKGVLTNCGCVNKRYFNNFKVGDIINDFEIMEIIKQNGVGTFWYVKCPYCSDLFVRLASNIAKGHYKSCGCLQKSLGEIYIEEIFKIYNINYKQQVSFKDLKNGTLRFDFLVIFNNKEFLIEFDGLQHYYSSCYFSKDKKGFQNLKYNDNLKDEYAKKNNIPLLRIPYILNKKKLQDMILKFLGG